MASSLQVLVDNIIAPQSPPGGIMHSSEMIKRIKAFQAVCNQAEGAAFGVVSAAELADGVVAVHESDGEYAIFFDSTVYRVHSRTAFKDLSSECRGFPVDTGFVEHAHAQGIMEVLYTMKRSIRKHTRGKIRWHQEPVQLQY